MRTNFAKYLGLHIDDELAWSQHVAHITKSCAKKIGAFKILLSLFYMIMRYLHIIMLLLNLHFQSV